MNEFNEAVENLELNGSVCVSDTSVCVTIDLHKDVTKVGSSYIELPVKYFSIIKIQNKTDNDCGIWCTTAHLHPVKTIACKLKSYKE